MATKMDEDERWEEDTQRGNERAWSAAEVDCHFGRVGAGNKIGCSEKIEELFVCYPLAAANDLLAHHSIVRCGATEANHTQLEEEAGHLTESMSVGSWGLRV